MIHRLSSVPHDRDDKNSLMNKLWKEDPRFLNAVFKLTMQTKFPHMKAIDDVAPFQKQVKLQMENGECTYAICRCYDVYECGWRGVSRQAATQRCYDAC